MNLELRRFLDEFYAAGVAHDAAQPDRLLKHRNLEPPTAELLSLVVRIAGARRVVEVGTANGYSTVWLADALGDTDGHLVTLDTGASDAAQQNLAHADAVQPGLARRVEFRQEDGGAYLAGLGDGTVDLLFLDAERVQYPSWWPHPVRVLRRGAVLAIDNVLSHPDEVAPFLALLAREPSLARSTVAVGKGLHLAWAGGAGRPS
jgi:predicted O-methyltransferase YrrM